MSQPGVNMLGTNSSLGMGVTAGMHKRQASQISALGLGGSSVVTVQNDTHYVNVSSSDTQDNLNIENVLVTTESRIGHHLTGTNCTTLQHSVDNSNHNNYSAIEYVTLQDEHPNKFTEGLVPVSSVNFVDMNESAMKANSDQPLALYFDEMPTTSTNTNQVPQANSFLSRHEHQTPKAQLLVRAYSDFGQGQQQQQQQQLVPASPDTILPDVLDAEFVQLEQTVVPINLNEYRKTQKLEPQKRHIQIQMQQEKVMQGFSNHDSLNDHHIPHSQKLILDSISHHESLHNQHQMPLHDNLKEDDAFQNTIQPSRYQVIQKPFSQLHSYKNYVIKDELTHHEIQYQSHHNKSISSANHLTLGKENDDEPPSPKINISKSHSDVAHHLPMVSRSGRLIRRRPEYIEYVNQNLKEEQIKNSLVKSEVPAVYEGDQIDDEDNLMMLLSNDDDRDHSGAYSSDGKKSLPHKKRIAKKHKNVKKNMKIFKCWECSEQFDSQINLDQHRQTHNNLFKAKSYNCEICNKACDSQFKFFEHLKSHYESLKRLRCDLCSGEFSNNEVLQEHMLLHSREHFKCNICHKTFRKESMLEVHMKVAHLVEVENSTTQIALVYSCNLCSETFNSNSNLESHVQNDHNPLISAQFNCEDCLKEFKTKAKLLAHRKVEHKEETSRKPPKKKPKTKAAKGSFPCTLCPRTFTHKNSYIYHVRSHTGERPYECDQCHKAFFAASALKVHQRLHTGEKPYKCKDCIKSFRQWGDLKYHSSSVHTEERQFQCEFCGKDFKRKYCLVVHRRIHTGEKKYKCNECNKCFRASSYLQNHIRIHTGERPYPCPDCKKTFRVGSDMKRHRQTHLREAQNAQNAAVVATSSPAIPSTSVSTPLTQSNANTSSTGHSALPTMMSATSTGHVVRGSGGTTIPSQLQIVGGNGAIISGSMFGSSDQSHPIRIMVTHQANASAVSVQPPPAHRQVSVSSMSHSGQQTSVTSSAGGSGVLPHDVIIMEDGNSQPMNLNILPRMISTPSTGNQSGPHEEEQYELISTNRSSMDIREEGGVCVWNGIQVFTS